MNTEKILTVAQVVTPIFVTVFLGVLARRRKLLTPEQVQGLQQFALKFGMPCVVFTSCLTADMGVESLSSMALGLGAVTVSFLLSLCVLKKHFTFHSMPMLFAAQETGMLGIPLVILLFGAENAYRMGGSGSGPGGDLLYCHCRADLGYRREPNGFGNR